MRELARETPGKRESAEAFDAVGAELESSCGRVSPRQARERAAQRRKRVVQWKLVNPWHPYCERAYAQVMPRSLDEKMWPRIDGVRCAERLAARGGADESHVLSQRIDLAAR